MTIAPDEVIAADDVNTAMQQFTSSLASDAATKAGGTQIEFPFYDVTSATDVALRSVSFIADDDYYMPVFQLQQNANTGFVGTARMSGFLLDNIVVTETAGTTPETGNDTSVPILSKGASFDIVVETTNPSACDLIVSLVLMPTRRRF